MDAASIAITLCSLCIDGYRSFQSLKSLGTDAQVILAKIEIQEYRLQHLKRTLETIRGTETGPHDLELVRQPVHNTLHSIKLLTTDANYLRSEYRLKLEAPAPCGDDDETTDREDEKTTAGLRSTRLGRHPKVFKWLLFDKANMERVATELKTLTDGLEDLLALTGRHRPGYFHHARSSSSATILGATIASLATTDAPSLANVVAASVDTYPELAADAERKLERLAGEGGAVGSPMSPRGANHLLKVHDFSFVQPCIDLDNEQHQRREVVMAKGPARDLLLVEWRPLPTDFENRERALARLATTAMLLQVTPRPAGMRTLDCPGYVVDDPGDAAALVYAFPKFVARQPPVSLLGLLKEAVKVRPRGSGNPETTGGGGAGACAGSGSGARGNESAAEIWRRNHPPLEMRLKLALALAETVFRLHMSGWLHRCIGAHNVLFFAAAGGTLADQDSTETGGAVEGLTRPYLAGFGFSREEVDGVVTETVLENPSISRYRHPNCQGPFRGGFRARHDLYSLGMVLLEIGFWRPFDRPSLYNTTIPAWESRDKIIARDLSGSLAHHTGSVYEEIVRTCLTGEFGCDMSDDVGLQQRVYNVVLEPLRDLVDGLSR